VSTLASVIPIVPPPLPVSHIYFVVLVMRKGGRAVEVVTGISAAHWKCSVCTATRTSSYSAVGPSAVVYIA